MVSVSIGVNFVVKFEKGAIQPIEGLEVRNLLTRNGGKELEKMQRVNLESSP